jgi:hypothetical protein
MTALYPRRKRRGFSACSAADKGDGPKVPQRSRRSLFLGLTSEFVVEVSDMLHPDTTAVNFREGSGNHLIATLVSTA